MEMAYFRHWRCKSLITFVVLYMKRERPNLNPGEESWCRDVLFLSKLTLECTVKHYVGMYRLVEYLGIRFFLKFSQKHDDDGLFSSLEMQKLDKICYTSKGQNLVYSGESESLLLGEESWCRDRFLFVSKVIL